MKYSESINAIAKAYSILHKEIENVNDLKTYGFTLAEYYFACDVMEGLRERGKTEKCFIKSVADFFSRCGFDVVMSNDGANYIISI